MGWLEKQNKGSFVGNVNDGNVGMTSMELVRDGLYAKKGMDIYSGLCLVPWCRYSFG